MARILIYFGLMAVGWLLSSKGLLHEKLSGKIANIQTIILFGLIFVMGIKVGMDEQVISSIGTIGLKAFVFAAITTAFSIILVNIVRRRLFTDEKITGGRHD